MKERTFYIESYSSHSYASSGGDVDVMWENPNDEQKIEYVASFGCLDDAHDDFVRHLKDNKDSFDGRIWVRNDVTNRYELIN